MQLYKQNDAEFDLAGSVLVLPAVAFANIGELAIDVLVCTLKAQLVARLDDDNLLACVGNNAYTPQPAGLLATALELYQVPGSKVFLLQQRAPAIPGRQQAFSDNLVAWAKQAGMSHLLLLCGLDAQYRKDQQLEGSQLRYLASSSSTATAAATAAAASEQQELQQYGGAASGPFSSSCSAVGLMALEQEVIETEREVHTLLPPWPLLDAMQQQGLDHTMLTTFAAEGDNAQDGMGLAAKVLGVLHLQGLVAGAAAGAAAGDSSSGDVVLPALQVPCSWVGLYGRIFDKSLF